MTEQSNIRQTGVETALVEVEVMGQNSSVLPAPTLTRKKNRTLSSEATRH